MGLTSEGEDVHSDVLRLLGSVFRRPSVSGLSHICFIITSRPEPWIRDEFTIESLSRITRQLFLGQTAEDDIRTFLRMASRRSTIAQSTDLRCRMSQNPGHSIIVLGDLVERASAVSA